MRLEPPSEQPRGDLVASGLQFPESPVWCADGSLLVVEIARGTLSQVRDGEVTVLADCGGGPNAVAVGPDGSYYVCNNGGLSFTHVTSRGLTFPGDRSPDYNGGSIQRVDALTGRVSTLYGEYEGAPLCAPCDIVFDDSGGFWFTDHGHSRGRERDWGSVFYARADGSRIDRVIDRMDTPNGIGLSPDGSTLYVAETNPARLWAYSVGRAGVLDPERHNQRRRPSFGGRLVLGLAGYQLFDSLAVEATGGVAVATMGDRTGITVAAPEGTELGSVALDDPAVTNICFGGVEGRTAYVTLAGAGKIVAVPWSRPGLALAYGARW